MSNSIEDFISLEDGKSPLHSVVSERIAHLMPRVLEHFADPNVDPEKGGRIVIKIDLVSNEERRFVYYDVGADISLKGLKSHSGAAHLVKQGSSLQALEQRARQSEMFEKEGRRPLELVREGEGDA